MKIKEIIETLEIIKAAVEWDYPLDYAIAIDEAIKILKAVGKEDERTNKI